LDDVPDRYFMARLSDAVDCERLIRSAGRFDLNFVCPDPHAYALTDEVYTISAAGSHAVNRLKGSAASEPVYSLKGVVSAGSSSYISITTNSAELRVVGALAAGETLIIDGGMVTAKVADALGATFRNGLPCLQELNFPVLNKGANTVTVSATGAAFTELKIQAKSRWR
jgi:phage-related protein